MVMQAQLADGRILEFPDGTDPSVIQQTVKRLIGEQNGTISGSNVDTVGEAGDFQSRGADFINAIIEPTATLVTGLAAQAPAAVYSIAQGLNPLAPKGSFKKGYEDTLEAFTYQPRTEAGKQGLLETEWWGDKIASVIDLARTGESTYENTGNELLAIINETFPEIVGAMFGGAGLSASRSVRSTQLPKLKADPTGKIEPDIGIIGKTKELVTSDAKDAAIQRKLLNEPADASTAKFKLESGKVVKDPLGKNAIKQGWSEPIIAMVKSVSKKERLNYKKMVSIVKKKLKTADYDARPGDVAGKAFKERVDRVQMVNTHSGNQLSRVAKDLRRKSVDVSKPIEDFRLAVDEIGGKVNDKGKLSFDIDSQLYGQPGMQKALRVVMEKVENLGSNPDAFKVHELKQSIDSFVGYGKKKQTGLSGKPERIIKNLRHSLNESLKGLSKKYDKVNTTYSETINALNELQSAIGKIELTGEYVGDALGTKLRVLLGNTQNRTIFKKAIQDLENVAIKYGGKYKDKMSTQMKFANELERMFGPMTETSLKADIAQVVGKGIESLSPRQAGVQATRTALERMSGINQANAFKAIETLLNQ